MMLQTRLLVVVGAVMIFAACGGGGQTSPHGAPILGPTPGASPNAYVRLTIVASNLRHGTRPASKKRKPLFVDGTSGATVQLNFYTYNPANGFNNQGSAPSTSATIPVASPGPTTATVSVFSGSGYVYARELDTDGSTPLASNSGPGPTYYTLDPGTTDPISVTMSLVPAPSEFAYISTDPSLNSAYDVNYTCLGVGINSPSPIPFVLVPVDNESNYLPSVPATTSGQTPPPTGSNGTITLTGITNGSDAGGTSTVVATGATWNGYTVYNFVYTPAGNGDPYAPAVTATANAYNPDSNQIVTEPVTISSPQYCED